MNKQEYFLNTGTDTSTILEVRDLVTAFQTESGLLRAVDGVSFDLKENTTLGIVGESGCGKTVTALSLMRLLPKPTGQYLNGEIIYKDRDILKLSPDELHEIRGNSISMIFQEPMTALNPVQTIGRQLAETFELHFPEMSKDDILKESVAILTKVGISDPDRKICAYPHQLSGGMRQRVMIAMALSCKPGILIADEPTTALDVTIQAQILELIKDLQKETGMSLIFITHDLGVIAQICDEILVMYAGKVVERAPAAGLFQAPSHPYTKGLLSSIPKLDNVRKSKLDTIKGIVPAIADYPDGCRFQNRCPEVFEKCREEPHEILISAGHYASCFRLTEK
ncbi:MAG: ABC transporter ATP-binding protein [Spirochaetes bacterium]|nr:ABC transporter ATP-binding protein [Spirochaetota bacterium]